MTTSNKISTAIEAVFEKYNMGSDQDGVADLKKDLIESLTDLFAEIAPAPNVTGRKITVSVSKAGTKKNNSNGSGSDSGSGSGKKKGNYYADFYKLICSIKKDKIGGTDWELSDGKEFGFHDPSDATMPAKRQAGIKSNLETLNKKPNLIDPSFTTQSLRELYTTLVSELPGCSDMQLTSVIWNCYVSKELQEEHKAKCA